MALAVVRDGIATFPVALTDQHALQIRVLAAYRDQIITAARLRHAYTRSVEVPRAGWKA